MRICAAPGQKIDRVTDIKRNGVGVTCAGTWREKLAKDFNPIENDMEIRVARGGPIQVGMDGGLQQIGSSPIGRNCKPHILVIQRSSIWPRADPERARGEDALLCILGECCRPSVKMGVWRLTAIVGP